MVSTIISIIGTILIFILAKFLYKHSGGKLYFTPILICPLTIGIFLVITGIPYSDYAAGGNVISWMLQPTTVAFALPLYRYRKTVKNYAVPMASAISIAAIVALLTSIGLTLLIGLGKDLALSIAPRSVTTPLALATTDILGGNPTITAILVIATGIIGMIITSMVIEKQKIRNSLMKGLMFGITAHGTGAAKAYEDGPKTGAIASLAMIFMGIFTTLIAPAVAYYSNFFK